jgi:hypothetical protein
MKSFKLILSFAFLALLVSCSKNERGVALEDASSPGFFDSDSSSGSSPSGSSGSAAEGSNSNNSGLITAGEWNDLENWTYWIDSLLNGEEYASMPEVWGMYPKSRVSVLVEHNFGPAIDIEVELRKNGTMVWKNRTDNKGKAELWIDLFDSGIATDLSDYSLYVDGSFYTSNLVLFEDGVNHVQLFFFPNNNLSKVDLAFIVDATGSMGDEIDFLKSDLKDVIQRVENDNSSLDISTGTVFYRDEGDEYLVKHSPFTDNIDNTIDFIGNQNASGGGDFPEAVHTALDEAINTLNWSEEARTRIAFLLLDAPPHKREEVISSLNSSIVKAAQQGIKLVPITASGVNKQTEFLMRFFSISTNSTYVFITNDSGIGNNHIEASVGEYEVEFLNDLMVRLIAEYTD